MLLYWKTGTGTGWKRSLIEINLCEFFTCVIIFYFMFSNFKTLSILLILILTLLFLLLKKVLRTSLLI